MEKGAKRRQNHACDQCRKSKRACETRLPPVSPADRSHHRPPSCIYCLKTKKRCTFVWAQAQLRNPSKSSPGAIPTDQNEQLAANIQQQLPQQPQQQQQQQHQQPPPPQQHLYGPEPVLPGTFVSPGEASYPVGMGPGDVLDMLAMKQQDPSCLNPNLPQQLDMFSAIPLDMDNLQYSQYSSPSSNSTEAQWVPPSAAAAASLDMGNQSFWGSLPNLSSDGSHAFASQQPADMYPPTTTWPSRDSPLQSVASDLEQLEQLSQESGQNEQDGWTDYASSTTTLSVYSPQDRVIGMTNNAMISENLLRIYHDVLEHNLSCWLAEETCPYGDVSGALIRMPTKNPNLDHIPNELGSTWSNKVYSRVRRLDSIAQSNRLLRLRPAEDKAAGRALDLVVMAFASQWALQSSRQKEKYNSARHTQSPGSDTGLPPEEFDRRIQRSLWNQAEAALEAVSGLECFRVVCAELIFGLCQRPLDEGETEGWGDGPFGTGGSKSVLETLMSRLRDAMDNDRPPIFMERGTRKIHTLKCQFDAWEAGLPSNLSESADAEIKEGKRTVQLLYWLAVMFDTISSSVNQRPVVVADEECQHDAAWDMQELGDVLGSYEEESSSPRPQKWNVQLFIQDNPSQPRRIPSWPCSYDDAAAVVTMCAPVKVLLFRHVSYLQSTLRRGRRGKAVEDIINGAMVLYKYWNVTYGPFLRSLIRDYDAVPPRIQSWFVCLWSHWHLAVFLLAETIDIVDKRGRGLPDMARRRTNSGFCRHMAYASALEISDIAAVAAPKGGDRTGNNATYWSLPPGELDSAFHSAVHEGAILTEPWTVLIIRAFTKAATSLLERVEELWRLGGSHSPNAPEGIQTSLDRCEHCTRALWLLGKKSDMARKAADILSRAHAEMASQLAADSAMGPAASWEGILDWIST